MLVTLIKTLSKSHNFVTFFFLFCDKGVSVHVASALFSLTKGLNYLNHGKTWTENSVQLL